ncbi:hypothetical protein [Lacihabitans lacunae]|uniref:CN hydrolase domain-containing protein n=1 Tax=Lacihabitans lacunae TaxID=1028214 RepID=A0ABV7Z0Z4_9BACT
MYSENESNFTIRQLIRNLTNSEDLFEWLYWPPNLFALTSIILHRTGSYRVCQIEELEWNFTQRNLLLEDEADHWIKNVGCLIKDESHEFSPFFQHDIIDSETLEGTKADSFFEEAFNVVKRLIDFELIHLRIVVSDPIINFEDSYIETAKKARELAKAIVDLHSISDLASATMGIVDENYSEDSDILLAITIGNFLLTSSGSLSTLNKLNGVVLPKYRTPQQGQSLRSLSFHLTYHLTETEVVWRTIPWLDTNEKTLNVLAVPIPFEVHSRDFSVVPPKNHPARYFKVNIEEFKEDRLILIHSIVEKLIELRDRFNRIHIVVFPELSLTKNEYDYLLMLMFKNRKKIKYLPIVIAGIFSDGFTEFENINDMYNNEVKIANYFAGRWYDLNQRKHHRWRLDKNQLIQYQLSTKMTTQRNWFEYIASSQRKLTILAPNSWLSITALICEDLARLEPVAEVIRGIGPTLLMALLSDGPQLSNRWPARYATVLADDPGTSVLSLTSLGMAKRSKIQGSESNFDNDKTKHVIGLWKDSNNPNKEIFIPTDKIDINQKAILLSLTAKYKEENTLDGRTDNCFAPEFELDTYFPVSLKKEKKEKIDSINMNEKKELKSFSEKIGGWNDIREISLLYYALDNIVESKYENLELIKHWLHLTWKEHSNKQIQIIYKNFKKSLQDPLNMGLSVKNVVKWPPYEVKTAIESIEKIINEVLKNPKNSSEKLNYYSSLFEETEKFFIQEFGEYKTKFSKRNSKQDIKSDLEKEDKLNGYRIKLAVCIANCILINSKINDQRIKEYFQSEKKNRNFAKNVQKLRDAVNSFIEENFNEFSIYPNLKDVD